MHRQTSVENRTGLPSGDDKYFEQSGIEPDVDLNKCTEDDQQEYILKCGEITRRTIGKAIIEICGHEGTENDNNKANLRRLLQAAISHIEKEETDTWKDAEVKIYDDNFDVYSIRAGNGRVVFLATFDGLGNPQVVKTSRSKLEANPVQRKQCSVM